MTTTNKEIVRKINKGFETDDTEAILSCVIDDVRWEVAVHLSLLVKMNSAKKYIMTILTVLPPNY